MDELGAKNNSGLGWKKKKKHRQIFHLLPKTNRIVRFFFVMALMLQADSGSDRTPGSAVENAFLVI